jgi:hypothetical protein
VLLGGSVKNDELLRLLCDSFSLLLDSVVLLLNI